MNKATLFDGLYQNVMYGLDSILLTEVLIDKYWANNEIKQTFTEPLLKSIQAEYKNDLSWLSTY